MATVQLPLTFEAPAVVTGAHPNSQAAYAKVLPTLRPREQEVLKAIQVIGAGTAREVARHMGFGDDITRVAPRIVRMLAIGVLEVCGNRKCNVTGEMARVVRAKQ